MGWLLSSHLPVVLAGESSAACEAAVHRIILRNDDLCALSDPTWETRIQEFLLTENIPHTLAVIPLFSGGIYAGNSGGEKTPAQNKDILALLTRAKASPLIELAMHGYQHRNNRHHPGQPGPENSSEFSGLELDEQQEMIRKGLAILDNDLGIKPDIFVPPWEHYDTNTVRALKSHGFELLSAKALISLQDESTSLPVRHFHLDEIYKKSGLWRAASCLEKGNDKTAVVLMHSWDYYSEAGLRQFTNMIKTLKKNGLEFIRFSQLEIVDQRPVTQYSHDSKAPIATRETSPAK